MVSKREEFAGILERTPGFLTVRAPRWIILGQEELEFSVTAGGPETAEDPVITCQGRQVAFTRENERVRVRELRRKRGNTGMKSAGEKAEPLPNSGCCPTGRAALPPLPFPGRKAAVPGGKKSSVRGISDL